MDQKQTSPPPAPPILGIQSCPARRRAVVYAVLLTVLTGGAFLAAKRLEPGSGHLATAPGTSPQRSVRKPIAEAPVVPLTLPGTLETLGNPGEVPPAPPGAVYASEAFLHVPVWIPRPADAIKVTVEDATLRSDGLREGRVTYTLAMDAATATSWLELHLTQQGMAAQTDRRSWQSLAARRFCRITWDAATAGRTGLRLEYQEPDHGSGCACPTCHGSPSLLPAAP